MPGCSVHTYLIVPALSGVNSNDPPLPKFLDLKSAPESAVTLWSTESSLTHLTFWPTFTVVSLGANWMFCILISTSLLALDDAGALVAVEPPPLSSPPPHMAGPPSDHAIVVRDATAMSACARASACAWACRLPTHQPRSRRTPCTTRRSGQRRSVRKRCSTIR